MVYGKVIANRCLFWDPYKIYKCTLWTECRTSQILSTQQPLGLKRVTLFVVCFIIPHIHHVEMVKGTTDSATFRHVWLNQVICFVLYSSDCHRKWNQRLRADIFTSEVCCNRDHDCVYWPFPYYLTQLFSLLFIAFILTPTQLTNRGTTAFGPYRQQPVTIASWFFLECSRRKLKSLTQENTYNIYRSKHEAPSTPVRISVQVLITLSDSFRDFP